MRIVKHCNLQCTHRNTYSLTLTHTLSHSLIHLLTHTHALNSPLIHLPLDSVMKSSGVAGVSPIMFIAATVTV